MTVEVASPEPRRDDAPREAGHHPVVLIAGNPNAGKTTVFNLLSGARAKVGNYPGVTVDRRSVKLALASGTVELVDLPGTYSLTARSPEEEVAARAVLGRSGRADAVVVVVDATSLGRGLYLVLQIAESGVPTVLALNMMDEARGERLTIEEEALASALGVTVVPMVASRGQGREALLSAIERAARGELVPRPPVIDLPPPLEADVASVEELLPASLSPAGRRAEALWLLLSLGDDELSDVSVESRRRVEELRGRATEADRDVDAEIIAARYAFIDALLSKAVRREEVAGRRWTDRIDSVLTHPIGGFVIFAAVMFVLFEALFSWAEPLMDGIEWVVVLVQGAVRATLPDGPLAGLLADGVVAGVGNVVVFVPQIALLFLFIGVLEDSGYLARVAFVIDRVMASVGLHGKAFVPLLSGFACAIPAVMATRTIESRRDRLVTMLALPLMSCSARLPVYVLVIATVFAGRERLFGVVSPGAAVLFAMYSLSVAATLGAAAVFRRTALRGPRPVLLMELPPYRWPLPRNLLLSTWQRVRSFLVDAGTIILALTIVLWALLSFPRSEEVAARHEAERTAAARSLQGEALAAQLAEIDAREAGAQLEASVAGRVGKAIEPALEPLGFDWRIGIGILGAFAAREVFVSTLGIVFGIGEADEESEPLREALREARRPDGSPLMTPLSGVALMVFFVLAAQCMSTLAVVRRESGSWKWPLFMFAYMSILAYLATLLVYQGGLALGLGP